MAGSTSMAMDAMMSVSHLWYSEKIVEVDKGDEDENYYKDDPAFRALLHAATLCNGANFKSVGSDVPVQQRQCDGDAYDVALLKFAELKTGDALAYRKRNKKLAEIPYKPANMYQISIHETNKPNDSDRLLVMKGAPEHMFERCRTILIDGEDRQLDDELKLTLLQAFTKLGSLGQRVLGFCDLKLPHADYPSDFAFNTDTPNFPVTGLRFVGLIGMADPPPDALTKTVAKCRAADMKVVLITGDHPVTAKAMAKSLGIIAEDSETVEDIANRLGRRYSAVNPADARACVVHGNELPEDDRLDAMFARYSELVFARASPDQKRMLREICRSQRPPVVAVTSEHGVENAPALKVNIVRGLRKCMPSCLFVPVKNCLL